jgi:hypothetical protein
VWDQVVYVGSIGGFGSGVSQEKKVKYWKEGFLD